jgi:hypothetical protein
VRLVPEGLRLLRAAADCFAWGPSGHFVAMMAARIELEDNDEYGTGCKFLKEQKKRKKHFIEP